MHSARRDLARRRRRVDARARSRRWDGGDVTIGQSARPFSAVAGRSVHVRSLRQLQRFLGLGLRLRVTLAREGGPLLFEFGLAGAFSLPPVKAAADFLAEAAASSRDRHRRDQRRAPPRPAARPWALSFFASAGFGVVDRLGRRFQRLELERDELVEQRVDDAVARLRFSRRRTLTFRRAAASLNGFGIVRRRLGVDCSG